MYISWVNKISYVSYVLCLMSYVTLLDTHTLIHTQVDRQAHTYFVLFRQAALELLEVCLSKLSIQIEIQNSIF